MKYKYYSYKESCDFLRRCEQEFPSLVKVSTIGSSWEGREILLVTVSIDVKKADAKPALLYTGTIHAREWIGNELAMAFIKYVTQNYQFDPKVASAFSRATLYMVPCLNPDGFEYSREHFSFWRKNRRRNPDGSFGVDLNRNFSVGFKKTSNYASNIYGGPEPFSEPETAAIKEFVDARTNITVALDYHSQGNVFFPAHRFRHETEEDGTDLNTLCANMAYQIRKVTDREYGIHRGKPPSPLIQGSGREYYYSKGIIAAVAEVGTRNIPDYMQNMQESVYENIPALLYALSETPNYSHEAPPRVQNFKSEEVDSNSIRLSWDFESEENVYFELYRNPNSKQACNESSLIAVTKMTEYRDTQLKSNTEYFYYIRAVDMQKDLKSPFALRHRVRTKVDRDEFSRIIFPLKSNIGYVGEHTLEQNRTHFGENSLFVGVNERKGRCYGVVRFNLENIPENAVVKNAKLLLYPMNRVGAKIEKYGEWIVSILDQKSVGDITDFADIEGAKSRHTLGQAIKSEKLTQGIWQKWIFTEHENNHLEDEISENRSILLRLKGPTRLPKGRDSQMMQFDIGYGRFGGGLHYRPMLEVTYTVPPKELVIGVSKLATVSRGGVEENKLYSGFDENSEKIYGFLSFSLSSLPDPKETVITEAYVVLQHKTAPKLGKEIRYYLEFVDIETLTFNRVRSREKIEYLGYELSNEDLEKNQNHYFTFDSYSLEILERVHSEGKNIELILNPKASKNIKNKVLKLFDSLEDYLPKLVINYISKRKEPVPDVTNLATSIENKMVKIIWKNPDDSAFKGAYVVRNRFRPPRSPSDGEKLYGGKDNYTYDNFGALDVEKYYGVFTYDDVPNYSAGEVVKFIPPNTD